MKGTVRLLTVNIALLPGCGDRRHSLSKGFGSIDTLKQEDFLEVIERRIPEL